MQTQRGRSKALLIALQLDERLLLEMAVEAHGGAPLSGENGGAKGPTRRGRDGPGRSKGGLERVGSQVILLGGPWRQGDQLLWDMNTREGVQGAS